MRKDPVIVKQYKDINKNRIARGEETIKFDYLLLCNKICGTTHYKMQLKVVVVEDQAAFDTWYATVKDKSFENLMGLTPVKTDDAAASTASSDSTMNEAVDTLNVIAASH